MKKWMHCKSFINVRKRPLIFIISQTTDSQNTDRNDKQQVIAQDYPNDAERN